MTDKLHLRSILIAMHRPINLLMYYTSRRYNSQDDWYYANPVFGKSVLKAWLVDELIAQGWLKIVQLDAYTEYLTTTEAGKEFLRARNEALDND